MPTRRALLAALGAAGLGGCSLPTGGGGSGTPPERSTPPGGRRHWYTHPEATGNRSLAGGGNVRDADPVTFSPEGAPRWLVAHPAGEGSHWTVVTEDGRASRWRVRGEVAERVTDPEPRPTEGPPVVATGNGAPRLVDPPGEMAAGTAPMVAPAGDAGGAAKLLYVAEDGALVVAGDRRTRFEVDALPDGRLAALGDGRYALFTAVTDRYEHGALGDSTEGTTLTVVDPAEPALDWQTTVGPPEVFEGLQPLVADLDGDGDPEVVTTVADAQQGARIAVFGAEGDRIATGPVHSPGWRHQLTVGPFGPGGRPELAVVRKPHVDHTLEFYRLRDGDLDVVATVGGFSTHTYGSRVLDGAVAGDFDDDGTVEALVPTTDRDALAAVRRSGGGASVRWRLPLDGLVVSNVAGISLEGTLAVGVGTGATVSVWQG